MINVAWMAGLFEGEGSIYWDKSNKQYRMNLQMTDKDIVDRFHNYAQAGHVYNREVRDHKDCWQWKCSKRADIVRLLSDMLPFFGERRAFTTLNALDYYDDCFNCNPPEAIALG